MHRAFLRLDQFLNFLVARPQSRVQCKRRYDEPFLRRRPAPCLQARAQQIVHCALVGLSRAPNFLLNQPGHIVIEGKSRSHIMMLVLKAS